MAAAVQPLPRIPDKDEIIPAVERITTCFHALQRSIIQDVSPSTATFATVVRPWVDLENTADCELGVIWLLQYAAPRKGVQDTVLEARSLWVKEEAAWQRSEAFYRLLCAVEEREAGALAPEDGVLLEKLLLEHRRCGCGVLDEAEKTAFAARTSEIEDLCLRFQSNISQESGGLLFAPGELEGLPPEELARWQDDPAKNGPGAGPGPAAPGVFITFGNGGARAVLTHARRADTRRRMYLADATRLGENVPLLEKIVKLRHAQAVSLGFKSWAEYRIQQRMAKTVDWVEHFVAELREGLVAVGRRELEVLQRCRRADSPSGDAQSENISPWDLQYYQDLVEKGYKVDHAAISEFFPLGITSRAMLDIFALFFGLRFQRMPQEAIPSDCVWHETVQAFTVWDKADGGREFLGYLYLDLLWRENKYRGNQNVTMQFGYLKPDGKRAYPSTVLMCSFPTSRPDKPTLLKHSEVVTLFHELGHGIHNLVSRTKYCRFHGTNLPPDFGEIPSVMLENWCWMPDVLRKLSCHYSRLSLRFMESWRREHPEASCPPREIPAAMAEKLVQRRFANRGLHHLFQLSISLFDLEIHNLRTDEDLANLDIRKAWFNLREDIEGLDFTECRKDGSHMVSFTHLTAGYDVGYYAYLCCSTLAADIFQTKFKEDSQDTAAWVKYRREILEPGGSPPDLLRTLTDFLGHPPNTHALIQILQ